ncbi:hypothetical protein NXY56_001875 [Leishmania guyanensis]
MCAGASTPPACAEFTLHKRSLHINPSALSASALKYTHTHTGACAYGMRASHTLHSLHRLPLAPFALSSHPQKSHLALVLTDHASDPHNTTSLQAPVASLLPIRAALAAPFSVPFLYTPVRRFRTEHQVVRRTRSDSQDADHVSAHDSATDVAEVRPIHTMQDLHTALLGFARAAATPLAPRQALLSRKTGTAVWPSSSVAAAGTRGEVALDLALPLDSNAQSSAPITTPEGPPASSFAASAVPNGERHLLHRLLLHRRRGRWREHHDTAGSAADGHGLPSSSSTPETFSESTPTSSSFATAASPILTGASWYCAFQLFSEAVQKHHVSPTAQQLNLLLYIAQQHALWGRMDDVEEFWAHLLSSVQQLRQEKMHDKRRVEQTEWRSGEGDGRYRMAPELEQRMSSSSIVAPTPAITTAALIRQMDELREMEQALIPNAQTYELLLGAALVRGAWDRALEYCGMITRSGVAIMTDASVRLVLRVYILAGASGSVAHPTVSSTATSPPHRLRTNERGKVLRAAAQPQSSSSNSTTQGGPAQEPYWSVALHFFRSSFHRVSSMHTVWCMATLLHRANQSAELMHVVREDCQQLVQTSLRSLAAHALTSVERAALLRTLKMVSDAACELGDWRAALHILHEVIELRRQLLSGRSASLDQLWGVPHPSGEVGMSLAALAGGDASSVAPGAPLSHPTIQSLEAPHQIGAWMSDNDILLDESKLSQHILKNTLHTLRRVCRYTQVINVYREAPGKPAAAVDVTAGAAHEEEEDDATKVWRSMWTPSAVSYVAQAALAVQDLGLLLELCGLTAHGLEKAKDDAVATSSIPAEVYDAALRLIQHRILRQCYEAEKSVVGPNTAAAAVEHDEWQWDVLSQRVYRAYRQRALRALAEETSPYRAFLERACHASASQSDGHAVVARSAAAAAAVAECDAPPLSPSHKPLIQLLAKSLQSGLDASAAADLQQQALKHLQRIRHPDTLTIALAMDILRSQVLQRRFPDAEAQSLLVAVQQVLDIILAEQPIEAIQLLSASLQDSATHRANCCGSARSQQSSGHHRCRPGSASLATLSPSAAEVDSKLTPAQLASLSTLTAAAVHMSFDILARVQPLTLLTYIPACVKLAWLPSAAAPAQLQLAQQVVVQWADEELKRSAIFAAEPHRATMAQMKFATAGTVGSVSAAAPASLCDDVMDASPAAIEASGRNAVAHFVVLYTHFSSRKAVTSGATPPLVVESSTAAAAARGRAVLDAAAQVLVQLQRSKAGHPPTAAMSAFIEALRHAWTETTSPAHSSPPLETLSLDIAEMEVVVVTSLNAVVQQVGASTVGRWTMWGDCVDMLMTYMDPPLSATRRRGTQVEKPPAGVMQLASLPHPRLDSRRRAEATHETLRVLHMFMRLCDKAETGFVERVTMDWLLLSSNSTGSSSTRGSGCTSRESENKLVMWQSEAVTPVEHLRCLCEQAHEQLRRAPPAPHDPFSPPELESMHLLLDALTWACRRRVKPLVRRMYWTLAPWLDTLLRDPSLPSPPSPTSRARPVAACAASAVAKRALLHQQLSRLRETALAACMTVAQCLSSGPRVEVLQDWQLQLRALRQLTDQGNGAAPLSDLGSQQKAAALIDGIAAVAVKLQRTWRYLLTELALDSHRAASEARQRRSASPSPPPLRLPASVLKRRRDTEDAAESFAAWCSEELLPRLVLSCLRACVEHEALSGTAPAITPPPCAAPSSSSPRAVVTAALHRVLGAVWDVDFVAFAWQVDFCAREGLHADGARAQALARWRTRGYRALSTELSWPNPVGTSQRLARHLHIWVLFTAHSAPTQGAVAELCRDLATLDVLHGVQRATSSAAAQPGTSTAGRTATAASPISLPFFLFFVQEADTLAEAKVTEVLSSASCADSVAAAAAGTDDSSSHMAELPRMADGRTAMEHLTNPLVHYTPLVLRVVQQAAQWVLYLTLCEGTVDVQAAGGGAEATHRHSSLPLSAVAQKPRSVGCTLTGRAALSALLLHRCLAWTGQTHAYHALLCVVEATAHETLREPEAVVYVFRYMERLGRAAEGTGAAAREGETIPSTSIGPSSTSPAEAFLAFYMSSTTLRRASPVSEQVCLAALLACAANTRRDDDAVSPPSVDLLTLLTAFTHVVSDHLVTEWQQGRLSPHQVVVLTEWMLRLFWGGAPVSPMDASTGSLKRYGAVATAAAEGNVSAIASAPVPLRRASMQWLLVTRGTILPPPLWYEGDAGSKPASCDEEHSSPQPSPAAAAASERILSLVAVLDTSSERFAALLGGVVFSPSTATEPLRDDSTSTLSSARPASDLPPHHPSVSPPTALVDLVRNVLKQLTTRHATQQLLHRYQSPNDTLRPPVRVADIEVDVLVQVLPEDARDSAKATLRSGADPAASYGGDPAREASRPMRRSDARRSVQASPVADDEGAVELESWLDAATAHLVSRTPAAAPAPTPLPVILRCPGQAEDLTWSPLYTRLLCAIKSVHQCCEEVMHTAACASGSRHKLDAYVRRRANMLRPALLRLMSNLSDASSCSSSVSPSVSPSEDGDVSPCVKSLLLIGYVLVPLQSLQPPPSLTEVLAVVRQELWRLLLACSSANGAGAGGRHLYTSYNALVQLCVHPLMLDALPQLRLSVSASNGSGEAAFEAVAYLLLLVHQVGADAADIRALSSTLADTAASSTSQGASIPDPSAVDALQQTARELLHLAGQELYHLHANSGLTTSSLASASYSPELLQILYRRLVRAWMQAGVLLGDAHSLLWGGQRLTSWSLQRQQKATALGFTTEGNGAVSASTAPFSEVAEDDAATEWLCVLPVAVLVAVVCSPARRSSTRVSETLYSLAAVLPLPRRIRASTPSSQDGSSAVAADEYVSLFRHWQKLLQGRATEHASGHRGCQQQEQHRRSYNCPFTVILHGSVPADATLALVEAVRRQVGEYLAGSATSYPPQPHQAIAVSSAVAPTLGGDGGSSYATVSPAALWAAFQCMKDASEGDMRAFMRLEAAKRTPVGEVVGRGKPEKVVAVQAAWRLIHRAALQERQQCGSGNGIAPSWIPLVPPAIWRAYLLNLHPVVPHTVHFIPVAVTEVVMLQSCTMWAEAMALLKHSLGTLHRSGATPVQQYMAQLLLERVRHTERDAEGSKTGDGREGGERHFCVGLEAYTYTVQQVPQPTGEKASGGTHESFPRWHLWSEHMAQRATHGTAALVCHIIDLIIVHHMQTTAAPTRDSSARSSSVLAKHTLMEALRCGVHDPALTRILFRLFWAEQYRRVKGAHAFLSALRAAKLARSDALALEAMLTYLWVSDPNATTTQQTAEWTSRVLQVIDACEARATIPGSHAPSSPSSVSAWRHLKVAAGKASELQGLSYRFSVEAHRATWKSWAVVCRLQVVPKDVALCVVHLFKQYDRLTEVEELMVTTCYDINDDASGEACRR